MAEWISVKDRLPDKPGHYLVCTSINYWHGGCLEINEGPGNFDCGMPKGYYGTTMSVLDCYYCGSWNRVYDKHVTHWMPLPDPPKEIIKPKYISKQKENIEYTIEEAPFRWGGLFHNWNKTAGEWANELTETGVPDNENQYKQCFYCEENFPKDEPLYAVVVTLPDGMKQFKLLCRNCAYEIASAVGCKVIEPYSNEDKEANSGKD